MPYVPFIVGAVVGAAATYVMKDDSSKQMLKDTGDKVTSLFKKDSVEDAVDDAKEAAAA